MQISYHPFLHGDPVPTLKLEDPKRCDKVKNPFSLLQLPRVKLKTKTPNGDAAISTV